MNFGNPAFLWALPAALIPILVHLLHRRKPKTIDFSHLALLRLAHQSRMPKRRLRDLILLIMRTLLILFLVALFARPVVRQGGVLGGQEGRVVVLLDVSASMAATFSGRTRLESAREEIQKVLGTLAADSEVGLITFSDRVEAEQAPTRDRARLIGALSSAQGRARPSDVLPALKAAGAMLKGAQAGTVLIVSDQAANVWRAATAARGNWEGHDPRTRFVIAEVGEAPASLGVVDASLSLSEEGNLHGRGAFLGNKGASAAAWTLELNGRTVGKGELVVSAGQTEEADLQAQLPGGGYFAGKLFVSPDAMPSDDAFYLAGRVPKGFRVLLIDGERGLAPSDSELYYLKSALESPRDPRIESIETITPDALSTVRLSDYDAVVIGNAVDIGGREAELRSWVEAGGGLLLSPGSKWPRKPGQVLGLVSVSGRLRKTQTVKAPEAPGGLLGAVSGLDRFEWKQIQVEEFVTMSADGGAVVSLSLEDGTPFLSQRRIGKGNVALLSTTLDRAWTNLPSKPVFAPLVRELIASLADPLREQTSLQGFVDEPVRLKLPDGVRSLSIVAPDGTTSSAGIDREGRLEWTPPPLNGLYEVRTDRPEQWFKFAVNMRDMAAESDTRRARESDVKEALPDATVQWVAYRAGSSNLLSIVQGRDITNVLLVLLFALLLAETILSWRPALRTALVLLMGLTSLHAGFGNHFVYGQLTYDGAWDPYPQVHERVFETLKSMTNIPIEPQRQVVRLADDKLFEVPFLLVKGNSAMRFSKDEKTRLRRYIDRGGFVLFDDTLADPRGPFAESVRELMAELYPERPFHALPLDHALFRSFFLLRNVAGRRIADKSLEGLDVGGEGGAQARTAVVYCPNDLLGAWMRDPVGQYTYACEPGGESQRWESFKLTVNVIYFSLTGTYKKDAIHQPFIEMKLGS